MHRVPGEAKIAVILHIPKEYFSKQGLKRDGCDKSPTFIRRDLPGGARKSSSRK